MTATFDEKLSIERIRNQLEIPGYFSMQPDDLRAVLNLAEKEAARPPVRDAAALEQEAVSIIDDAVNAGIQAFQTKGSFNGRGFTDRIVSLSTSQESLSTNLTVAIVAAIKIFVRIGLRRSNNLDQAISALEAARRDSMEQAILLSQALLHEVQGPLGNLDQKILEALSQGKKGDARSWE